MSPRRLSPILLPEGPGTSRIGWLWKWVRRIFGEKEPSDKGQRTPGSDDVAVPPGQSTSGGDQPPHQATVQLLPGRLEPLLPEVIQQEVRFQRAQGLPQEVTLGWELGDPPHHVTLDHPSIQPIHARMTYQNGRWMIESLTPFDPVEVNGTPVPSTAGPYLLASGDQVRIGEALFRFHMP